MTQSKNNVSVLELKRHLGVRYKAAWLMKHKLLQVMAEREESRVLGGRVEIDDVYLAEVQYRFNRRVDLTAILARLLRAAVLTGPRPERVIRAAERRG